MLPLGVEHSVWLVVVYHEQSLTPVLQPQISQLSTPCRASFLDPSPSCQVEYEGGQALTPSTRAFYINAASRDDGKAMCATAIGRALAIPVFLGHGGPWVNVACSRGSAES